nr:MAG TPA: hypothetical protein [Caudoviricetes sp.]
MSHQNYLKTSILILIKSFSNSKNQINQLLLDYYCNLKMSE